MWVVAGAVFVLAVTVFVVRVVRHDRAMHGALRELQEWNLADTVFRSDSAAQVLVDYFDHPWHSANDQMLAYYLLGRAHADMGEAPQAIEDYQTAVECADTTDQDCNLYVLSAVYGQMAEVFDAQNLPEDELSALRHYSHFCLLNGDTIAAIHGYLGLERPYYLLNDTNAIIQNANSVRKLLLFYGYHEDAAKALLMPAYYFAAKGEHYAAKEAITIIKEESGLFNDCGFLMPGNEMFYYTLGLYHEGVGQLDSAEYYYRQLLPAREYEAAYKGLLSVYSKRGIPDSIAKFAPLYADANDAMHREMNSATCVKPVIMSARLI